MIFDGIINVLYTAGYVANADLTVIEERESRIRVGFAWLIGVPLTFVLTNIVCVFRKGISGGDTDLKFIFAIMGFASLLNGVALHLFMKRGYSDEKIKQINATRTKMSVLRARTYTALFVIFWFVVLMLSIFIFIVTA